MRHLSEPSVEREVGVLQYGRDQLERRVILSLLSDFACACCLPPPGSLVKPAYKNAGGNAPAFDVVEFPGGVIAGRITEEMMTTFGVIGFSAKAVSPSHNCAGMEVPVGSAYDDVTDGWSFRPVEDFGCNPGTLYGIWFSFLYHGTGTLTIESRSSNTVPDSETYLNGGGRHPNAASTTIPFTGTDPTVMPWADPADQAAEYPRLDYFGLHPIGGEAHYGDWPCQAGGSSGLWFTAGERITVRAYSPDGVDLSVWLDHLVFMPTFPLGMADITELDTGGVNFSSSALEVIGYTPASGDPPTYSEPTDEGTIFEGNSAVDDTQSLRTYWDLAGHFTIAFHDESDVAGLHTGVGGVHIYVMCRAVDDGEGGHVTCFTGSQPLADIICDETGAWVWAYAGIMPLGDGPQAQFGMIQWVADGEYFPVDGTTSVRTSFVAYLPQAPCEAATGVDLLTEIDEEETA